MLLMIDNYDSFTYNLVQYFEELRVEVRVVRNDELGLDEIAALRPDQIVISPGPGTPDDAGVSLAVVRAFAGELPILGVCLGHQAIGQAFGARVVPARQIMHGKVSTVEHGRLGVFCDLPSSFTATRYHSLVLDEATLPACLEVTAWTSAAEGPREVMGIRHRSGLIEGVQFHPESVLSEQGHQLLQNFLQLQGRRSETGETA